MAPTLVHGLRVCFAAVALAFAVAQAAEPKEASPVGLTRDQVITRYGEPKSQIVAGNRLIMFFARERLVLRDGVVVEVERLAAEPRRGATAAPAAPATSAPPPAPPPEAAPVPTATPTPPAERTGAAGAVPAAPAPTTAPAGTPTETLDPNPPAPAPSAPKQEPTLEIKSVRPPSANYSPRPVVPQPARPTTSSPAPKASPPPATAAPAGNQPAPAATSAPGSTTPAAPTVVPAKPAAETVVKMPEVATNPAVPEEVAPAKTDDEVKAEAAVSQKKAKEKKMQAVRARRRIAEAGEADEPELTEAFLTTRTLIISFLVVGAGAMYLLWRNRQRQLLLSATAVSHSPFIGVAERTGSGGAAFMPELLAKLEWQRFEELVADYYAKTGVVAVRTKAGPASPVNIKISWKGEPRPFACVQCIAHPVGLIDAKPLQELVAVIAAEDIRRGYVVTAGKFGVAARDYAEEKHLTLLPGDIFLEKLNALPESARSEIMQAVTTGDYQTPSCPKCEAKMVKSSDDPTQWRCLAHPDQVIPAWQ